MYFQRKTFLLDRQKLERITGHAARNAAVLKLLERKDDGGPMAACCEKKTARLYENAHAISALDRFAIEQPEEKYITGDDCTNLRIELELCTDSKSFIDRL